MAAKLPNKKDKGRCARCDYSEMQDIYNEGKLHRWCTRYGAFCQRVAWNCNAPSEGIRLINESIKTT